MRYELSDFEWAAIKPFLPNKPRGVPRVNDRRVLNGIFWVLRSGAPWRDVPDNLGPYTTCYNRFVRWRRAGVWSRIMNALATAHDASVQMIDTSIVRVHQHGACIVRNRRQSMGRSRGGDRKSTRLNSSHLVISYAVFCLKKKIRSIVWGVTKDRMAATRIAARGGQVVAALLVLAGIVLAFRLDATINGLWFAFIAYILWNAATATLQQERITSALGGAKVGPLMATDFKSTPPGVMVGQLIRDLVLPMNLRAIPVVSGERLIGLVAIGDLRKVDQARWAETPVEQVMTPAAELSTVSPDDPLGTPLEKFSAPELPLLPVIKDGRLVGVLYRESVIGYVRMQEMLAPQGRR